VEARIEAENIRNVTMLPFQPYEKIGHVFSLGDCGLIISKKGIGQSSVPSKTWSVMSAERPVLASFDKGSELDDIVTGSNCGICVEANDPDALRTAILQLAENKAACAEMGKNGRRYIEENLTREIGTSKWVETMRRGVEGEQDK
jgi:glycosyltransferase involved in cell wall biosynthesis